MNGLPKNLFKTFIISIVVSIAVNCIYYAESQKGGLQDYQHIVPSIASGAFFLNIILGLMSIPSLFLANPAYWNKPPVRFLLYFAGPVLFLATVLFMKLQPANAIFYFTTGIIFLIVHAVFYFRLTRKLT